MFRVIVLLFSSLLVLGVSVSAQDDTAGTEILWDTWGVPHIYADTNLGVGYAYGWAQMHAHGNLILELYAASRGRAAEYFGESFVQNDVLVAVLGFPEAAVQWYDDQSDWFREYVDEFARGMNDYAAANPDAIRPELQQVLPITGTDPLAHALYAGQLGFVASRAIGQIGRWEPGSTVEANLDFDNDEVNGSNTWAIAPSRSESGNPMLVANPHLSWSGANTWFEAQLVSPDIDIYGASLVGWPVIQIGFNDNLGWSHTVNTHDGYDLYEFELNALGRYTLDGETVTADISTIEIPVRQQDGSIETITQIRAVTQHGPVVAQRDGYALALRVVGNEASGVLEQWWNMATSSNLDEFTAAISAMELTTQTIMYADREGNIMHVFNGHIPVREEGDFVYWYDIVPGNDSSLIWDEIHPFEDLPRVVNPESGWLQNANEPPWTTTFPLAIDYTDYPAYVAPEPFMSWRSQSSASMLYDDNSITYEELVEYKHSTEMELAARIVDDIVMAVRETDNALANEAVDVLEAWDLRTDADSQGAVLFLIWDDLYRAEAGDSYHAVEFELNAEPFTTPDGLGMPDAAVTALEAAAQTVLDTYGALDVAWGDVYRMRVGEYDLPANGGSGGLGEFRVTGYRQAEDNLFVAYRGDSFVAVVEFADEVQAQVLISYGNSSQEGSPHVGDQLVLYAEQRLREAWRTRDAVEANLAMRETFE